MLKSPIRNAVDQGDLHWLWSAYHRKASGCHLPDWPEGYNSESDTKWTDFEKSALKIWLDCKMTAEKDSHTTGLHSGELERQFTETDCLVERLLLAKAFSEAESNIGLEDRPGVIYHGASCDSPCTSHPGL